MGTAMLSILCGHWRYAHINSVRGDAINAGLPGMEKIVSEDVVRTALKRMDEAESLRWVQRHILASISPALNLPWILDIDTTVKCLYGHQEGAQIGYNPRKPGRPCHVYHSYFVANLRISLGVEVLPGKEHASAHSMAGLWAMLEALPRERWPTFVRGDCGYGNESVMSAMEERDLPCLLKLRHTPPKSKPSCATSCAKARAGSTAATDGKPPKPPSSSAVGPGSDASSSCAKPLP